MIVAILDELHMYHWASEAVGAGRGSNRDATVGVVVLKLAGATLRVIVPG